MTFNELMDGLAAKYSIDGLAADGGILSLQIDGMSVTIVEGGDDAFVVTGFVCDPPAENGELFANMLPLTDFDDNMIPKLIERVDAVDKKHIRIVFRGGLEIEGDVEK